MSVGENVWSDNDLLQVRLPSGEVRSGTRKQLEEALQVGHIDGSALVLASGAREWVKLESLPGRGQRISPPRGSSLLSVPPDGVDVVWQVKLSRRQVEAALRAGHFDESVLVLVSGARDWAKLGSVLSEGPSTRPSAAPVSATPSAPPRVQAQSLATPTDTDREVWQVQLASGEVRTGSRQHLVEAMQAGHLDASALVLASGTTEWVKLGSLVERGTLPPPPVAPSPAVVQQPVSAVPAPARPEPIPPQAHQNDVWQVRLASGDVRSGTREQVEEAARTGHLDSSSLVLASGTSEWVTLSSVIDRGPEDPTMSSSAVSPSATSTAEWPAAEVADAPGETGPSGQFISETTAVGDGVINEPPLSTEPAMERATDPTPRAENSGAIPDATHPDDGTS